MADPLTWTAIGLTVVSGAVSAFGAMQQGEAEAAAANRSAQVAERNRILADQDRQLAIRTSQIDAEDKRREDRRHLAAIEAAYGNSGLELSGSFLDVLSDTSEEMALDQRRIEFEGRVRGREGAIKMQGLQEEADASRAKAANAKTAGGIKAIGYLMSSGASAAGSYATLKRTK